MISSRWVSALALAALCSIPATAAAQNGGRESPAPTYAPPPNAAPPTTFYAPPPAYPTYAPPPQGPSRMPYEEGDPVPPGYRVVSRTRTGLVVAGSIVFGVPYGLGVLGASGSSDPDTRLLYVPVAGPVLYGNTIEGDFAFIPRFFLWMDTLVQTAGAIMLTVGLIPKTELVRNDVARVHIAPLVTANAGGLALGGVF